MKKAQDKDLYAQLGYVYSEILIKIMGLSEKATGDDKKTMQAILDQLLKDFSPEVLPTALLEALDAKNFNAGLTLLKKVQDQDLPTLLGDDYSDILAELSNLEERASDQDKKILQSIKGRLLAKPIK